MRSCVSNRPYIATDDVHVGLHGTFGRNVRFNCRHVVIEDGAVIEDNVRIDAEFFQVGDYATIYEDCFFPDPGSIEIGYNFWLGRGAIMEHSCGVHYLRQSACHRHHGDCPEASQP